MRPARLFIVPLLFLLCCMPFGALAKLGINFDFGPNNLFIKNKLRFDGFYSKNLRLLNNDNNYPNGLDKIVIPAKFTWDLVGAYSYHNDECDWNTISTQAGVRFKGVFGAPESSFRTGFATIKDLEVVQSPHSHPINVHILVLRELWLNLVLNETLGLSFDHKHTFTVGFFPFSLGRGIALGDAYAVVPDFIGYDPANSVEQYAPGFKLSGAFLSNRLLEYDLYAEIMDNLSDSFSAVNMRTQGQMYGHRYDQARGYGVINYLVAGRFKLNFDQGEYGEFHIEPYGLFNGEYDQRVEFKSDATSKLGTLGIACEGAVGDFEFGFDFAQNVGHQDVKGIDRNVVTKELRDSVAVFVNSKVVNADTGARYPYQKPSRSTPNSQNYIERPMELSSPCDSLIDENGQLIRDFDNQPTDMRNASDRFRDPYRNYLRGYMAVADCAFAFGPSIKAAFTAGYASGDENPNKDLNELGESVQDGIYNGFISLQELYSGKRVRSAFMLSGKGKIPRILSFPVNNDDADINPYPSVVSRFTNIAFVGMAGWITIDNECRKWSINPNVLAFWQAHASRMFDCTTNQRSDEYYASRFLGIEVNNYFEACLAAGLKFFVVTGVFVPGSHYDDIKGRPLNKVQQVYLDSLDRTGAVAERVPVLGNDSAFFINGGLEYRF